MRLRRAAFPFVRDQVETNGRAISFRQPDYPARNRIHVLRRDIRFSEQLRVVDQENHKIKGFDAPYR